VRPSRPALRRAAISAALVVALAAAPPAVAQSSGSLALRFAPPAAGPLSHVATRPAGAPAALDDRLANVAQPDFRAAPPATQASRLGLPESGPGSLVHQGTDVVVRVRLTAASDDRLDALRQAGAHVLSIMAPLAMATVAVAPQELDALAGVAGVRSVTPELAPLTSAANVVPECHGSVTSEADTQLRAAEARQTFGVTGAGVTVGIISDSFDETGDGGGASHDVTTGDLPGPGNPCGHAARVTVLDDDPTGEDEGRGMAQVIHDLAPGAALAFTPALSEGAMAQGIVDLANAGADVIVDDITFLDEPFFQEGFLADTADQVSDAGIAYFSSAANNNFVGTDGTDRASYEAPSFRATSCPSGAGATSCMNFSTPGDPPTNLQPFLIRPRGTIRFDFQWAEPWFGVTTDLNLFLFNDSGTLIASATTNNPNSDVPAEILSHTNPSSTDDELVFLAIGRSSGSANPRLKWVLLQPSVNLVDVTGVDPPDTFGPSIFGHNGGEQVMSVAAVPFTSASQVENFSSRGPVTHYFGPVTSTTPAAPLPAPQTLAKPDIAATDGAQTTFFGSFTGGVFRFFGTSEAAPHAAAIAALQEELAPTAAVAQIENAQKSTAAAVGAFGPTARGAGLVNALGAVGALRPAPAPVQTPAPTPARIATPMPVKTLADVKVSRCKQSGTGKRRMLRCTLKSSDAVTSASLTLKKGRRTVAKGTAKPKRSVLSLKLKRKLSKGRYTLRLVLHDASRHTRTLTFRFRIK
jgi:Subtilase family